MKLNNLTEDKIKDKLENVKQTKKEAQHVLSHSLKPQNGHTLFCYNKNTKEITLAKFSELGALKWEDAVKGFLSANKKVIIEDNCIYRASLNKKNFIKILKRDYNIF